MENGHRGVLGCVYPASCCTDAHVSVPWQVFETDDGRALHGWELVRFILFGTQGPYLPFRDKDGNKVAKSAKRELTEEELDDLEVRYIIWHAFTRS